MKGIITDLHERLHVLRLRHQVVFHEGHGLTTMAYVAQAERLVGGMAQGDSSAVLVVRSLVDPAEMTRSEFWGTPLGRLLFVAGGFGAETCSQAVAAGVLGCSRQWVSAMVSEGKLNAAPRGVYVELVLGVMQARAKRLSLDTPVK